MIIGDAIYSILSGDSTLSGLVGTKIYPVKAPQRVTFPYIVYSLSSTDPTDQKDGVSPVDDNTLEVDCYADSYRTAHTIALSIRAALDDYSGTVQGVKIRHLWFQNQSDGDFIEDYGFFAISQGYAVKIER